MIRKIIRFVLPFVVLSMGVAVVVAMIKTKPRAAKQPRDNRGAVVEIAQVSASTKPVVVKAHGTVVPARAVMIAPEVTGRVTRTAKALIPGGRFAKGEIMLVLDARDYRLALKSQSAAVKSAETALALQERQKEIVRIEWERMGKKGDPLTIQQQRLDTAKLAVEAAQSRSKQATLAINRTVVRAPFNAIVQTRTVDVGQIVSPARPVITLAGTDEYWVQISVPVERLVWLDIPGVGGVADSDGSAATVWRSLNGKRVERHGRILRLLGDVDPMGRMARLLVSIKEPLATAPAGPSQTPSPGQARRTALPLLLRSFVEVELRGRSVDGVIEIAREALREGDSVYVMRPETIDARASFRDSLVWADDAQLRELTTLHTLEIREVDVVWRQRDVVLIRAQIGADESIVTSPLPSPIQGMKLRVAAPQLDSGGSTAATSQDGVARP